MTPSEGRKKEGKGEQRTEGIEYKQQDDRLKPNYVVKHTKCQ